ncbi:hypothetical protein CKM354_000396100 [Cercospora kikuchii]|uniref:Zn(2)-C6 fungal-type domain-containing protein n=1 Tax=Cercospora kikuchii TaxID=84275 RepID=A0A9P3CCD8_9PEZI|nr:uncharacterized protein CKM354_000396100 [Cercospora kikuchii]GIZ40632.1 hypothetical protein CKM354_000396100 [Cercospora kikuchii]
MAHDPVDATTAPPARKRRRRTAASGATDDCFTCRKRSVKCDRTRPYCAQCIQIGKECSGYKTTLTWGVGVASRGKLRGLSCPIAGTSGEAADTVRPSEANTTRRRKSSVSRPNAPAPVDIPRNNAAASFHNNHVAGVTSMPSTTHAGFQPTLPTINAGQQGWNINGFGLNRPNPLRHHSLQHIHTALGPQYDNGPNSASSGDSFPDHGFSSPPDYPLSSDLNGYSESYPPGTSASYTSQPLSSSIDSLSSHFNSSSVGSFGDHMSSSMESINSAGSFGQSTPTETPLYSTSPFQQDEILFSPMSESMFQQNPFEQIDFNNFTEEEEDTNQTQLAIFDARWSSPFFTLSPRMQCLMEYYDRHICPYLIAFDGPNNPYRKHILQLAMQNEGLQNAIAALATNNIRMRKQPPPRRRGFVEEITDAFDGTAKPKELNEPTAEETCYKQMSIDQLNMQLTDTRAAQDDSVIATLLILCLFHVCDSGFSKFKTQLAGVQKLLSLRAPSGQSEFTGWVEMFFIWFDVMTSAVNDRETQIKSESLDMLDYSSNLGALEHFSGCDGRLFKLIARLGRLSLLAQGRPVRPQNNMPRPPPTHNAHSAPLRKRPTSSRNHSAFHVDSVESHGWGTPVISSDDEMAGSPEENPFTTPNNSYPDSRAEFWSEWNDIRARLNAWQMDTTPSRQNTPPLDSREMELGQRDLLHINESFRYSALLYTERLGSPLLPSSHPNFQKYVSNALFHITALDITSCVNKFLLWPLFIVGTECVDEGHRNIIRARCIEVQIESGFWNNISGLDVLEKVWKELGNNGPGGGAGMMEAAEIKARRRDSEAGRTGRYGQALRWRKAMSRVDGEYILI